MDIIISKCIIKVIDFSFAQLIKFYFSINNRTEKIQRDEKYNSLK